ncbi:hypothetical protein LTR84_008977 [Exophiala bonariae]|uniref:Uncharacterized protein n=1 Tax=Exophiala bonariae TaxID=1690606 RepID=A0AAV9MYG2_9EURO|nr:hypothetical protein LTR84_008977 [Exophiala bonariae]
MTQIFKGNLGRDPVREARAEDDRSYLARLTDKLEDLVDESNWLHWAYKAVAYSYLAFILWLITFILPIQSNWSTPQQSDRVPVVYQSLEKCVCSEPEFVEELRLTSGSYFGHFRGFSKCNIRATDLYTPPAHRSLTEDGSSSYCHNRKSLLKAMSNGGRIGFEAPYTSRDCHYRWYSVAEICMILDRFGSIVFVGDHNLHTIYSGFNILLRQDLSTGALNSRDLHSTPDDLQRRNLQKYGRRQQHKEPLCLQPHTAQFSVSRISPGFIRDPESVQRQDPSGPKSNYKPVPIIYSISPSTTSQESAASTLLDLLKAAESSRRKTPMLWIGPSAAGHLEIKHRKGNQEIWDFDKHMELAAQARDIDVLKLWNMTVQADSWDGMRFGEKVAITQAMMLVNWLSRLESS